MQINWVYITLGLQGVLVFQALGIITSLAAVKDDGGRLKSSGLYVGSLFISLITSAIAAVFFEEWSNAGLAFINDIGGGGIFATLIKLVIILWPTSVVLVSAGVLLTSLLAICRPEWTLVVYAFLAGKPKSSETTSSSSKATPIQDQSLSGEQSAPVEKHYLAADTSSNPESSRRIESLVIVGFAAVVLALVFSGPELGKTLSWCLGLFITGLLFGFLFGYMPTRVSAKVQQKKLMFWLVMPFLYATSFFAFVYLIFFFPLFLAEFIWVENVGFSYTYAFLAQIFTIGGVSLQVQIVRRLTESTADGE